MVGKSKSPEFNFEDGMAYFDAVKVALQDTEPEKYQEFVRIFIDYTANRFGFETLSASLQELLRDHANLCHGSNVLLPFRLQTAIPPEASAEFHINKVVGRSVPPAVAVPTMDDATSYLNAVKEAFHDEPAKYMEITKLLTDLKARRINAASVIARMEELLKDHLNLLLGFCVFLSPTRRFITKLKARFLGDGSQVVDSVLQILRMHSEGNKSKDEASQEVRALIQGHEDLLMELSEIFSDP